MSGLDLAALLRIKKSEPAAAEPTLRDWVEAAIAPPGAKPTDGQMAALDGLVNRSAARAHLRGRGPYQHFANRDVGPLLVRARRRLRKRRKRLEQRGHAIGGTR